MARREALVLSVPRRQDVPQQLGRLIDPGDGSDPFGTTPLIDRMLDGGDSRAERFDYYYAGWSNGYVQTQPVKLGG
jgi:hypothetical protein